MNDALSQLALALFDAPRIDFADFHGTRNQVVRAALVAWAENRAHWSLGVWGEAGVGKSHLLQAAIRHAHQAGRAAMYVPLGEVIGCGPGILDDLERIDALAIDDLDRVTGDDAWEIALFGLYNRCAAANCRWLFAAKNPPLSLPIRLPDLRSRLSAALIFQMSDPDDPEKEQILRALAHRRGMELSEAVANFLLRRLPRSMHDLSAALAQLDTVSLRAARPLTIPFVREALKLGGED